MAVDYKHRSGRSDGQPLSGAAGLAIGLAIGLGIAMAVYLHGRRPEAPAEQQPVADRNATPRSTVEAAEEPEGKQYDFYDMLPKFEVVVPEREKAEASNAEPASIRNPGAYVLQTGSYRNLADAQRVRDQFAAQGIEAKIQRVTIENDTWHRVRIGPIDNLEELNRMRQRLREADVDALVIRVGE